MKKGIVLGLMLGVFGLSGVGLQQYTYAEKSHRSFYEITGWENCVLWNRRSNAVWRTRNKW